MTINRRHFIYGFLAVVGLWAFTAFLGTTVVVGRHPEWRKVWARPQNFGLEAEDVSFESRDGIALRAWYLPTQGPPRAEVILAHGIDGNRSSMLPRAWFLVRNGYEVLDIDLRGHGESGGDYASPGYLEALDILAGINYLRGRGQTGPVIAMGHSYGAVAALWAAVQWPEISAVVSDSAYLSLNDMTQRATILLADDPHRSFWARAGLHLARMPDAEVAVLPMFYLRTGIWIDLHKTDTLVAIHRLGRRPILFISGERDVITPPENTRRMYDASRSPEKMLWIVPGADHDATYRTAPKLYQATVAHFLANVTSGESFRQRAKREAANAARRGGALASSRSKAASK